MDKETLKQEILTLVSQMIEDAITVHAHTGADSQQIEGANLQNAPQNAVTLPSGGATVDTQARASIGEIVSRLQALGFIN